MIFTDGGVPNHEPQCGQRSAVASTSPLHLLHTAVSGTPDRVRAQDAA